MLDNTDVRGFVDLSVYISCPQDIRFERRLTRDIKERKRTKEFVIKQFSNDVEPAHIKYIQPSSAHADLIIDQNDFDKQKFEELLIEISIKKDEYITKKNNWKELNYQNTRKNVNQKLLEIFNEY